MRTCVRMLLILVAVLGGMEDGRFRLRRFVEPGLGPDLGMRTRGRKALEIGEVFARPQMPPAQVFRGFDSRQRIPAQSQNRKVAANSSAKANFSATVQGSVGSAGLPPRLRATT